MIGLSQHGDSKETGERFTLTMLDPAEQTSGYRSEFPDLTEDAVREMLRIIGESDEVVDRLLLNARAECHAPQPRARQEGPALRQSLYG